MSFLFPSFLFALAAIAIPIIIHLFNFRRYKTVYFPNVKFLREVKEKTDSRSRLKHLLVLLCRILAITFLVFAFAQPFVKSGNTKTVSGKKAISIFIDNSFSMGQTSADVPLLDEAKRKAKEIVTAYNDNDEFQLLTNDFEGRHQRMVDKAEMLNLINEVKLSPDTREISEVISRQKQAVNNSQAQIKLMYELSDFQKSFSDLNNIPVDSAYQINFIPLKANEANNVFIDTAWMESPVQIINQPVKLMVRITNGSSQSIENGRITLKINDQIKSINDFAVDPGASMVDTMAYNITDNGWNRGELSIIDHPVTFDDTYFFTCEVAKNLNAFIINESGENPYLNAVLSKNDFFITKNILFNQLNYSDLQKQQFVVLNGLKNISTGLSSELKKFVEAGGNLAVFPDVNSDLNSYNSFFSDVHADVFTSYATQKKNVSSINIQDALFSGVFQQLPKNLSLPSAHGNFLTTHLTATTAQPVLQFSDGSSFITKYKTGNGNLYVATVPLDNAVSDLPTNPIFAPMLYNMSIIRSTPSTTSFVIGKTNEVRVNVDLTNADAVLRLKSATQEFIPPQRSSGNTVTISLNNEAPESGFYSLVDPNGDVKSQLALNFDRKESELKFLSATELKQFATASKIKVIENADRDLSNIITGQKLGLPLWKVCVIFVLIFIALEIILLKLWN